MTNEGELKKRIVKAFNDLPDDNNRNKIHAFYMQTISLAVFDEAKAEFPQLEYSDFTEKLVDETLGKGTYIEQKKAFFVAQALIWFQKWFGDSK